MEGFELCGGQWRRAVNHASACTRGRALLSWQRCCGHACCAHRSGTTALMFTIILQKRHMSAYAHKIPHHHTKLIFFVPFQVFEQCLICIAYSSIHSSIYSCYCKFKLVQLPPSQVPTPSISSTIIMSHNHVMW